MRKLVLLIMTSFLLIACNESDVIVEKQEVNLEPTETIDTATYESMKILGVEAYRYITSENDEVILDNENLLIPAFMDVVSFKKIIDDEKIEVHIEVRELPEMMVVNQSGLSYMLLEYCWRIEFDTDRDGKIGYDTNVSVQNMHKGSDKEETVLVSEALFEKVVWQHTNHSGKVLTDFELKIEGNTFIMLVEKASSEELNEIYEDTPFYIIVEYNNPSYYLYELVPTNNH